MCGAPKKWLRALAWGQRRERCRRHLKQLLPAQPRAVVVPVVTGRRGRRRAAQGVAGDEGLVAAPLPLRHDRGAEQQQRAEQEAREPAEEAAVDGLEPAEQVRFVRLVAVREERDPAQRAALHERVAREREGAEHGELRSCFAMRPEMPEVQAGMQ